MGRMIFQQIKHCHPLIKINGNELNIMSMVLAAFLPLVGDYAC
jgi:hypothetical protein